MSALKNAQIPNRGRSRKELVSVPRLPGVAEAKRMVGGTWSLRLPWPHGLCSCVCNQDRDWQSPYPLVCQDSLVHVPGCCLSHSLLSPPMYVQVSSWMEISAELRGMVQRPFLPFQMQKLRPAGLNDLPRPARDRMRSGRRLGNYNFRALAPSSHVLI